MVVLLQQYIFYLLNLYRHIIYIYITIIINIFHLIYIIVASLLIDTENNFFFLSFSPALKIREFLWFIREKGKRNFNNNIIKLNLIRDAFFRPC